MAATVWTPRRKWLGNLIPTLVWFPLTAIGLSLMVKQGEVVPLGVWLIVAATVGGWVVVNFFGLFENARMRNQLTRILTAKGTTLSDQRWFVGFASPKFSSAVDPHEDIGFLCLTPESLYFVSEERRVEVMRCDISEIRFRSNVHSVLLLGRWVSAEGKVQERPIRLMVEPREHSTLLRNRRESSNLFAHLEKWRKGDLLTPETSPP